MAEFPLISVIIPIYNVARYIRKGVESLLAQDYPNYEIILVDDGSPDNSGEIIDNFCEDPRVHIVHKRNGGVSSARNEGLRVCRGEYVVFVDGDDYVEPNYISYLYSLLQSSGSQIGFDSNYFSEISENTEEASVIRKVSSEKAIQDIYLGRIDVAVWNKIYSKSLLDQYGIRFDETIWYGEGMLFNICCLQNVEVISVGNKRVYHQTYNLNSAMRKFSLESNLCGLRSLEIQKKNWKRANHKIECAWKYHYCCYGYTMLKGMYEINVIEDNLDIYQLSKTLAHKNIWSCLPVDIPLKRKIFHLVTGLFPVQMAKRGARKEMNFKNSLINQGGGISLIYHACQYFLTSEIALSN